MLIERNLGACGGNSTSCLAVVAIHQLISTRLFFVASLTTKSPELERQLLALRLYSSLLHLSVVSCVCFRL